jgi:hypothetical protein
MRRPWTRLPEAELLSARRGVGGQPDRSPLRAIGRRDVDANARARRSRSIHEVLERAHEKLWLLPVGEMAAPRETRQCRSLDDRRRRDGVRDWNDRVALTPKERYGRQVAHLAGSIEKVAMLPAPVDDVPNAAREGARGAGYGIDPRELRDLVLVVCATGRVEGELRTPRHEWLAESLDDIWSRSEPKRHSDSATEASGGDEREPANASAILEEHPLRDASAVRMADEIHLIETERFQPIADDPGMPFERIARVRA